MYIIMINMIEIHYGFSLTSIAFDAPIVFDSFGVGYFTAQTSGNERRQWAAGIELFYSSLPRLGFPWTTMGRTLDDSPFFLRRLPAFAVLAPWPFMTSARLVCSRILAAASRTARKT